MSKSSTSATVRTCTARNRVRRHPPTMRSVTAPRLSASIVGVHQGNKELAMAKTVVGSFESYREAQQVVEALAQIGIARDHISIVARNEDGAAAKSPGTGDGGAAAASGAGKGAAAGGVLGGAAGLVVGLAGLAIPGIGPVIAAGPIAAA